MNVQGKYIKDESGNIISPITSTNSVFGEDGSNLNEIIENIPSMKTNIITQENTDLNDYITPGVYYFNQNYIPTNIPAGVNGWLVVYQSAGTGVKQIWYRFGTYNVNDHQTFIRIYDGTNWSNWTRLAVVEKDLINYLPLSGGELTGNLIVDGNIVAGDTTKTVTNYVKVNSQTRSGQLNLSSANNFGLYDNDFSKWVIISNTNGRISVDGQTMTYEPGDYYNLNTISCWPGYITNGRQNVEFYITLPKIITSDVKTVTLTAYGSSTPSCTVRTTVGYALQNYNILSDTYYKFNISCYGTYNRIRVTLASTTSKEIGTHIPVSVTNNTPVTVAIQGIQLNFGS